MPGNGGWNLDWFGSGTNDAVQSADPPGYQVPDRARNGLILLGAFRRPMPLTCGSRQSIYSMDAADTYQDHPDWVDVPIDWDRLKGDVGDVWTVEALISQKCVNVATTLTNRIVLAGTATLVGTATTAYASTSWAQATYTIPSSTGVKTYRLQMKTSDLVYGAYCIAELRAYVSS